MSRTRFAFLSCPIADLVEDRIISTGQDSYNDTPQLGVFLLAGLLREAGHEVDLIDLTAKRSFDPVDVASLALPYDVLFFSCNSLNWSTVLWVARHLRPKTRATFVIGGPHATLYPDHIREKGIFDVIWSGDAAGGILALVDYIAECRPSGGAGLRLDAAAVSPPQKGTGPAYSPAFDLMQAGTYHVLPVETSRGCKFQCAFCSIPSKRSWVPSDVRESVRRIEQAYAFLPRVKSPRISIIDDTFTTDRERVIGIFSSLPLERYAGRIFYDATAVDLLDERFTHQIAPYTSDLLIGAEVSSKADAKRIKKAATPDILRRAASNLKGAGLADRAVFSFIIGFPWHTKEDCLRTVGFAAEMIVDYGITVYLQWYWPIPGSEIWRDLEAQGRVTMTSVDEPGFFRDADLFFRARSISAADIADIDERIQPLQLMFAAASAAETGSVSQPLSYSPPPLRGHTWETRRMGGRSLAPAPLGPAVALA